MRGINWGQGTISNDMYLMLNAGINLIVSQRDGTCPPIRHCHSRFVFNMLTIVFHKTLFKFCDLAKCFASVIFALAVARLPASPSRTNWLFEYFVRAIIFIHFETCFCNICTNVHTVASKIEPSVQISHSHGMPIPWFAWIRGIIRNQCGLDVAKQRLARIFVLLC